MKENDNKIFDNLLKDKTYQELLQQLPEDEQKIVESSLKNLVDLFENNVLNVIKNFK